MNTSLLFGGAALTAIFTCWNSIKDVFLKFIALFIQTVDLVGDEQTCALIGYLAQNYKYSKVFNRVFEQDHIYLNKCKKYGWISYLNMKRSDMIFFNGIWPILFKIPAKEKSKNDDKPTLSLNVCGHLYFIRGTFDIETVLGEAVQLNNEKSWHISQQNELKRFSITYVPDKKDGHIANGGSSRISLWSHCKLLKHRMDDLGFVDEKKDQLKTLFFPKEIENKIELAKKWLISKEWYERRGLIWRTGWLLHGPAGCGKTSIVRAMAIDLDLPVFIYKLSELTAQQFNDNWRAMQSSSPCIALFEEFDSIFDKRKNISGLKDVINKPFVNTSKDYAIEDRFSTEITFDAFLTALDGLEKFSGLFTIITTNDLSKIDDALKFRPGRIDKMIELGYMDYDCKLQMAKAILGDNKELYDEIVEYVENNRDENLTGAQFQEKLVSKALTEFMKD